MIDVLLEVILLNVPEAILYVGCVMYAFGELNKNSFKDFKFWYSIIGVTMIIYIFPIIINIPILVQIYIGFSVAFYMSKMHNLNFMKTIKIVFLIILIILIIETISVMFLMKSLLIVSYFDLNLAEQFIMLTTCKTIEFISFVIIFNERGDILKTWWSEVDRRKRKK